MRDGCRVAALSRGERRMTRASLTGSSPPPPFFPPAIEISVSGEENSISDACQHVGTETNSHISAFSRVMIVLRGAKRKSKRNSAARQEVLQLSASEMNPPPTPLCKVNTKGMGG